VLAGLDLELLRRSQFKFQPLCCLLELDDLCFLLSGRPFEVFGLTGEVLLELLVLLLRLSELGVLFLDECLEPSNIQRPTLQLLPELIEVLLEHLTLSLVPRGQILAFMATFIKVFVQSLPLGLQLLQ